MSKFNTTSDTIKFFLNATDVDTFEVHGNNAMGVNVLWEIPREDILRASPTPNSFMEIFCDYLQPLADLMKLSLDNKIKGLEKNNQTLLEQLRKTEEKLALTEALLNESRRK